MTNGEIILTAASIQAIAKVLLVNADICDLYEKRGVTRDEIKVICRLAEAQVQASSLQQAAFLRAIEEVKDARPTDPEYLKIISEARRALAEERICGLCNGPLDDGTHHCDLA